MTVYVDPSVYVVATGVVAMIIPAWVHFARQRRRTAQLAEQDVAGFRSYVQQRGQLTANEGECTVRWRPHLLMDAVLLTWFALPVTGMLAGGGDVFLGVFLACIVAVLEIAYRQSGVDVSVTRSAAGTEVLVHERAFGLARWRTQLLLRDVKFSVRVRREEGHSVPMIVATAAGTRRYDLFPNGWGIFFWDAAVSETIMQRYADLFNEVAAPRAGP
jgi:hypothetical protein